MLLLRRLRLYPLAAVQQVLHRLPVHRIPVQLPVRVHIKYPHITLGIVFMIILVSVMLGYPVQADPQPAYLTLKLQQQQLEQTTVFTTQVTSEVQISMPVTGR